MSSRFRTTRLVALLALSAVLVFTLGISAAMATPVIGAFSPTVTNSNWPLLSVAVTDATGTVSAVTFVTNGIGQFDAAPAGGNNWAYQMSAANLDFPLVAGGNFVLITAQDESETVQSFAFVNVTTADITAPTVVSNLASPYNNVATITITPTDPVVGGAVTSGVANTFFKLDGGATTTGTVAVSKTVGAHTIEFWAVDKAVPANVGAHTTQNFVINDTLAPVTTSNAVAAYTSTATITLTATDTIAAANGAIGTGVTFTFFTVDGGATTTGTVITVPFSSPSTHTVTYWSTDGVNVETPTSKTFTMNAALDLTAPTTVSDALPAYQGSATIVLVGSDTLGTVNSGVKNTFYIFDGGAITTGTAPVAGVTTTSFTTSVLGAHTLEFWSVDVAGNVEVHDIASFEITAIPLLPDTTAPNTISDVLAAYDGPAVIHLTPTDPTVAGAEVSGVAHTYFKVDGGAQTEGLIVTVTTDGAHTLEFWSVDVAGNIETPHKTAVFDVNNVIPGDTIPPTTVSDANASYIDSAEVHLHAVDNAGGTGVETLKYQVDGGAIITISAPAAARAAGVKAAVIALAIPTAHPGGAAPTNCACHPGIIPPAHSGGATPASCVCHAIATAGLFTPDLPSTHTTRLTGCKACHPAAAPVIMPVGHFGQTAGFPGGGACESCHTFRVTEATVTPPPYDGTLSATITVTGAGTHHIDFWATDKAGNVETVKTSTFDIDVVGNFTITASAGANGSIAPAGDTTVASGGSQTYAITPIAGYHVADVLVDGVSVGAVTTYTFSGVTANHTIAASFAVNVGTFTITASAGANGSISPAGVSTVNSGTNLSYTITPDTGFIVDQVFVDGVDQGSITTYTFTNVTANHTISVTFEPPGPDVTTINIRSTATSVLRGRSFILSGNVTPDPEIIGTNIQVMVQKPNRAYYSYSSLRTVYATAATGNLASWWYRYGALRTQVAGLYHFYAFVPPSAEFAYSQSAVLTVRFR